MTNEEKIASLPVYTKIEDFLNAFTHGLGVLFGIFALIACMMKCSSTISYAACAVYSASLIELYLVSTLYHALKPGIHKYRLRILDHCSVSLLIAGTYTPCSLLGLKGTIGWIIASSVWVLSAAAVVMNLIDVKRFSKLTMVTYLLSGWIIILAFIPLVKNIPLPGVLCLVGGGVAYTVGAVIYALGKRIKYMHSIWHVFVLAGSVLQFITVYFYCGI